MPPAIDILWAVDSWHESSRSLSSVHAIHYTTMEHETKTRHSQRAAWSAGQPISDLMARALAAPNLISLAAGFVDQHTLPVTATRHAAEMILGDTIDAQAALQYGTTHGYPRLREAIRDWHLRADGGAASQTAIELNQIVLTAGSNQLLHLVSESLLDPGDVVLCAAPTYFVYLGTLQNVGARPIGVRTDADGIIPDALDAALQRLEAEGLLPRVKAIYVVTYFDNPCGLTVPAERRERIVEIARRWSKVNTLHVIADDAYRELRYAGDDVPSMRAFDPTGETVVQTGTFSKCYSPGIRVGWGILPQALIDPVHNQKGNLDFGSPNFAQHLMHRVLEEGMLEPHIDVLRNGYRPKLEAMLSACTEFLAPIDGVRWISPKGGLYVWLTLPPGVDAGPQGRLFDLALEEGMLYVPGQFCFPAQGEPVQRNTIRLSFGVQSAERIREGMEKLATALNHVL